MVTQLAQVSLLGIFGCADCHTERTKYVDNRLALIHLVIHCLLHIKDFASERQNGLELTFASLLRRTASRVTLDEKQLTLGWILA